MEVGICVDGCLYRVGITCIYVAMLVFVYVVLVFLWVDVCNSVGDTCLYACVYSNVCAGTLVHSSRVSVSGLYSSFQSQPPGYTQPLNSTSELYSSLRAKSLGYTSAFGLYYSLQT